MILGLDISTSITGATIINDSGEIVYNEAWDTRKYKNIFEKNKLTVTIRRSRGKDIDAACRQLANKQ